MNKRRLFASAMAACMLLSTMTSTALAFGGTENSNDQSQVQTLNDGTGSAANPDTSVGGADDVTGGNDAPAGSTTPSETPSEGEETGCGETCSHEAAIGEEHYDTVQAAAEAAGTTATEIDVLNDIESKTRVLTVKDGQNITLNLNDHTITSEGEYTISVERAAESGEGFAGGTNTSGKLTIIGEGTIKNTNDHSSTIRNYGTLTIGEENATEFPTITRNASKNTENSAVKCEEDSTLTIYGGTFEGNKRSIQSFGTTNIYGGTFEKSVEAWKYKDGTKTYDSTLTIYGGEFEGAVESCNKPSSQAYNKKGDLFIQGGYFTSDPTDYLAVGYMAGESNKDEYNYLVVEGIADTKPSAGESDVTVSDDVFDTNDETATQVKTEIENAAAADYTSTGLTDEDTMTQNIEETQIAAAKQKFEEEFSETDGDVTVHVKTYLDIQVSGYEPAADGKPATLTFDITPKYNLIASTETDPDALNTEDGEGKNALVVEEGKDLTLPENKTVTVTVPLPASFIGTGNDAATKVFVKHIKGAFTYYYTATVNNGVATFENPHGFSDFVFSLNNEAAAEINGIGYATLQDAVNAVANNGTIIVLKDGQTATVSREVRFTVETAAGATDVTYNITAGTGYRNTSSTAGTYNFVEYTPAPSYGGGSDYTPSNPTYNVSVPTKVENGSVSVSSKNPTKGSTVTLTVTPDKGYELATLTVTDKDGNKIALTDKGNGKFTFTMPASKVDIKATFVETVAAPEAPVNPFYDVAETDYFFDAVLWANENGITSGVGSGKFAPNATCTRAQMVTFLWNAAGCPNVEDSYASFTDVSANDYYYKAVLWAKANGITSGTGEGVFSPDQICNRAQMATFLYKFAEGKAAGSSNRFADVTASDYYAQPVQWAVENGITSGTGNNTFGPNDPCTRAQMVTFLYRLLAD